MMGKQTEQQGTPKQRVKKRLVFYFSGFDPRGASHYRKLYAVESAQQSAINGLNLQVGRRKKRSQWTHGWDIKLEGEGTHTDYEFLAWDDIIRDHWPKNEWQLVKAAGPAYWVFLKENLIPRLLDIAWPAALTVSYPLIAFFGLFLAGFIGGVAILLLPLLFPLPWWIAILFAGGIGLATFYLSRFLDTKFRSHWLLRIYAFMQPWAYGELPEVDKRLDEFARYMASRIEGSDADEIILVGHSVGTILTVSLVTRLLQLNPLLGQRPGQDFCLVSLGNCIPLVSLLSGSERLRDELLSVATAPGVRWYDFSARRDGASVTQIDPLQVSGLMRPEGVCKKPQQYPVRIHKMFPPEKYAQIKRDIFRIHFQYVMAGELLTDYDFFAITGGPIRLAERYPMTPQ